MVEHPEFPPQSVTAPVVVGQLSDPHLTTPQPDSFRELGFKRLLSYLSWRRKRRHRHQAGILAAVVADIRANPPDHLLVTGDLTHLGLPGECREALAWLESLGDPAAVSVIPGNHDVLVADDWSATAGLWQEFFPPVPMSPGWAEGHGMGAGDSGSRSGPSAATSFPGLRRCGPVALLGLNTAVPTVPFFADGRLGHAQCERVGTLLEALGREGVFRLVFLHHSPLPAGHAWRKRLRDAGALLAVLRDAGAELIVHGHGHHEALATVETASGPMLVVGAPSASLAGEFAAGWNRYRIAGAPGGWSVKVDLHRLGLAGMELRGSAEYRLARARPPADASVT
jgi:3',5'-cyclic AMP phosphodiesterase CpdA